MVELTHPDNIAHIRDQALTNNNNNKDRLTNIIYNKDNFIPINHDAVDKHPHDLKFKRDGNYLEVEACDVDLKEMNQNDSNNIGDHLKQHL
jgi:hypothetical protein